MPLAAVHPVPAFPVLPAFEPAPAVRRPTSNREPHSGTCRSALCLLATLLGALGSVQVLAGTGIDFSERNAIPVINRQIFELRLGATTRSTSSTANGGLLATVLTAGPTSGTTSLFGATLDGGTLFNGGPAPTFTTILASGSAFSLGGGCQRGGFTDFPFINANRPRIARFDAATGAFGVLTPTIAGNDFYDAIDCAPSSLGTAFVISNRTLSRVEIYRDNGAGFQAVNTTGINNVITPFSGGLRSAIAVDPLAGDVLLSVTRNTGAHQMITVDLATGAVATPCPLTSAPIPGGFTRPREGGFRLLGKGAGARRLIVADFDNDGTTDFVTVPAGNCSPTLSSGPAGSSNGGNGFNWTGYSTTHDPETHNANVLWGDYFYVAPGDNFAQDSALTSPYSGRGGPFHGCTVLDRDFGHSILSLATGSLNTTLDFALAQTPRALNNGNRIFGGGLESPRVLDTDAFATCP
jgi:hypothetical protein